MKPCCCSSLAFSFNFLTECVHTASRLAFDLVCVFSSSSIRLTSSHPTTDSFLFLCAKCNHAQHLLPSPHHKSRKLHAAPDGHRRHFVRVFFSPPVFISLTMFKHEHERAWKTWLLAGSAGYIIYLSRCFSQPIPSLDLYINLGMKLGVHCYCCCCWFNCFVWCLFPLLK